MHIPCSAVAHAHAKKTPVTSAETRAVSVSDDLKNVPGVFQLIGWLN